MRSQNASSEDIVKGAHITPLNELCFQTKIIKLDSLEDYNANIEDESIHTRYFSNKLGDIL